MRGHILFAGTAGRAVAQFRQALELDPGYAFARSNYAATL